MIMIIDYGLGNIKAFVSVYKKLNIPVYIATKENELKNATKIILPGVGAFDFAMTRLEESGMRKMLDSCVLEKNVPVLGICVGMQMLACSSDEGKLPGLGWINGVVKRLENTPGTNLPHMGWNDVVPVRPNILYNGINGDSRFYFLHSYYFRCENEDNVLATTNYGKEFACAVHSGNIYGVQFHPEKSHSWGIQLLKNFAELS